MVFYIFEIIGLISIITGILFIFNPILLIKLNEIGNKVIFVDKPLLIYPRTFGGILLVVSLYLIYISEFTIKL